MTVKPMSAHPASRQLEALTQAFSVFNATSHDLQQAWQTLQARVDELTRQRDAAQQARMAELAAKERLAERLRALLESLPAATVMLDIDGRIVESNAGAHELLGHDLVGAHWQTVAARALNAHSDTDGTPRLNDGRRLNVSRRQLAGGGSVWLLADDSEAHARRSGVERQQRQSIIDEMSARLAHQLRTPLATAILYLSRIAEGGLPAATCERLGGKALNRLRDLQQLLDSMLAQARGDRGDTADIDLADVLEDVRQHAMRPGRDGCDVHIHCPQHGLHVRGERTLLRSAMLNVVENGLNVATHLHVEAHGHATEVVLRFSDDGPGVPDALAARIFEPFFTTRHDGTGLGLAMARSVAQAHGGSLHLEKTLSGACFVMRLPRAGMSDLLPSGPLPGHIRPRHPEAT